MDLRAAQIQTQSTCPIYCPGNTRWTKIALCANFMFYTNYIENFVYETLSPARKCIIDLNIQIYGTILYWKMYSQKTYKKIVSLWLHNSWDSDYRIMLRKAPKQNWERGATNFIPELWGGGGGMDVVIRSWEGATNFVPDNFQNSSCPPPPNCKLWTLAKYSNGGDRGMEIGLK